MANINDSYEDVSFKNRMNNKTDWFDTENGKAVIYAFALIGWMVVAVFAVNAITYVGIRLAKVSSLEARIETLEKRIR